VGNPLTELPVEMLRARHSIKWRQYGPDVLPLWIAEMDTPLAPPITAALTAAVERGDTGYVHPGRLGEAFAGFAARRYGWSPDPSHMIVVPDVLRGIGETLKLVTRPGAGVVVNGPTYPPFFEIIAGAGRTVLESPLSRAPDGAYGLDLDALDRDLATHGVEAYLLCNPHNPTGLVLSRDELLAVIEIAHRHRVRILADEIHAPLTYPGFRHTPIATLPGDAAAAAVVFVSASKAWNLPGLKAALVVAAGDPAWAAIQNMPLEVTFGASLPGVIAGEAAFTDGDAWLDELVAGLDFNRHLLADLLTVKLPGAGYVPPQATFLAWLDLRSLGLGDDPAVTLLEHGQLALSSGPTFGASGRGHARLNLATSPWILKEAVRRMAVTAAQLSSASPSGTLFSSASPSAGRQQ
jgi:cystathionine beta-lyase